MRKIELKTHVCIICNQPIPRRKNGHLTSPGQYKKSLFCSNKCRGEWISSNRSGSNNPNYRGGKPKCIDCGKRLALGHSIHNPKRNKRCRPCWNTFMCGENHPNWKGGKRLDKSGYTLVYQPNHPFSNAQGCIREHRLVAEKSLGRYLKKSEVVHHINEVKNDNRPENLYLFPTGSQHREHHKKGATKLKSNLMR